MYVPESPGERVATIDGMGTWTGVTDDEEHYEIELDAGRKKTLHYEDLKDLEEVPENDKWFSYRCPNNDHHLVTIGADEEPAEVVCGACAVAGVEPDREMELVNERDDPYKAAQSE